MESDMNNPMTKLALAVGLIGSLALSAATPSIARSAHRVVVHTPAKARVLINQPSDRRSDYADDYRFWHRYDGGMEGD
jgi:hypothetical protein